MLVSSDKSCIYEPDMENFTSVCKRFQTKPKQHYSQSCLTCEPNLATSFQIFHFYDHFAPKIISMILMLYN